MGTHLHKKVNRSVFHKKIGTGYQVPAIMFPTWIPKTIEKVNAVSKMG